MSTVYGTTGNDTLFGSSSADTIWGFSGGDVIFAGAGNDIILGGEGADYIHGGLGNDLLYANNQGAGVNDVLDGGAGYDGFAFDRANFATQANGGINVQNFEVGLDYFIATGTGNDLYYDQVWDDFHQQLTVVIGDLTNTVYVAVTGANLTGELSSDYFVGMTAL